MCGANTEMDTYCEPPLFTHSTGAPSVPPGGENENDTEKENFSLLGIIKDTIEEDPSVLRVVMESDEDPTLLRITGDDGDEGEDQGEDRVPLHAGEFSAPVAGELERQLNTGGAEEELLSSHSMSTEGMTETIVVPSVILTNSSTGPETPVQEGPTYLPTEEGSSLLGSTSPPSGTTSTIMSPFIVELARGFPSPSSFNEILSPKIERDVSPLLLVPKLEPLETLPSCSGANYEYDVMVLSLGPECHTLSGCPDLKLYASSSEPSSPSSPSSSRSPFSNPAHSLLPDCPDFRPSSPPPSKPEPEPPTSLFSVSSGCMPPTSTSVAPSASSPSSAASFSNSLTSSPCESGDYLQSGEPMDCSPSPSVTSFTTVSPVGSCNLAPLSPSDICTDGEHRLPSGPPAVPSAKFLPRSFIERDQSGAGWPYAPQGWPDRDDKWLWRVGERRHPDGYYMDRFLGLPRSLMEGGRPQKEFPSKEAILIFLKKEFPHLDVDSFFEAFQWRIPYVNHRTACPAGAPTSKGEKRRREVLEIDERYQTPEKKSRKHCKVGNVKCGLETGKSVPGLTCDICCVEKNFCRECTCLLCFTTMNVDNGECNLVKCLQSIGNGDICGHGVHLECALVNRMAGVINERDLDMEYLCRRCDKKTDLRWHVTRLLEAVGNTVQRPVAEKSLQLALQIMQGTEHGGSGARVLETLVQTALRKVQSGADIKEVFSDLRDQGIAAEKAKHRVSSIGEDSSQQPEASLDQWLPSSGSPSSHPSPSTPSSFSSPVISSHRSVNSSANGKDAVEGGDGNHTGADGHIEDSGEPVRSPGRKNRNLQNGLSTTKGNQVKVSHRDRAGSSSAGISSEVAYSSQLVKGNGKQNLEEPASRTFSPGWKQFDQRGSSIGAGVHREEGSYSGHCKSCGMGRHLSNGLEVTSGFKSSKTEDEDHKLHRCLPSHKEGELTNQTRLRRTDDADKDHGVRECSDSAAGLDSEDAPGSLALGISLRVLNEKYHQQIQCVLSKLEQAQQAEFARAQERLVAQKDVMLKEYELLDKACKDFGESPSPATLQEFDYQLLRVEKQNAKALEERWNFDRMTKVAHGFGKLSKEDLSKFYGCSSGSFL